MRRCDPYPRTFNHRCAIDKRRRDVTRLVLEGKSQTEIGALLGVHQATISRDIAWVRSKWTAEAIAADKTIAGRSVAQCEQIRVIAIERFEASKAKTITTRTKIALTPDAKAGGDEAKPKGKGERTVEEAETHGDPRFLDIALRAATQIAKIVGLEKPQKHMLTDAEGNAMPIAIVRFVEMESREPRELKEATSGSRADHGDADDPPATRQ